MNRTGFFQRAFSLLSVLWVAGLIAAQDREGGDQPPPRVVAATIDNDLIYVDEVNREVDRVLRGRKVTPEAKKVLQAKALDQLVKRRLILRFLAGREEGASEQDVRLAIERIKKQLAAQDKTLDDLLKRSRMTEVEFRRALQWQIGWSVFLGKFLTEENLQSFFERNRRDFDGTQLHVAQIQLKVNPDGGAAALRETLSQAAKIRQEISSGKMTFAEAAEKYSDSPSKSKGGDIGMISREGPMLEAFTHAAFELDDGEISQPVETRFGVHLIRCIEVKPGKRTLQDVRQRVKQASTAFLFDWAADQQRESDPKPRINFTGKSPYFKTGTNELAGQ